ncbi:MAG: endonuclease [Gammaproteobacteria bacterium]|nr:endonuclease [Gammaproteobacteria bacterium]
MFNPVRHFLFIVAIISCSCTDTHSVEPIKTYEEARPVFWRELYPDGGETFYCQQEFKPGYNRGINIEHVFPMSWVAWTLNCGKRKQCRETSDVFNIIEADLHNLYPARSDINEIRSSYSFAIIPGEERMHGNCDFEIDEDRRLVEPRPEIRGEIARAMLYMADRYDLYLKKKLRKLLLEWHEQDPVTDGERQRNEKIYSLQGNRNHWIQ